MKRSIVLIFAAVLAPASYAVTLANAVGVYHWGGQYTTSMSEGVQRIENLGGHVARVVLSPRYYSEYNTGQGCYLNYSLSALAHEPDVKSALDNPSITVFMLTAFDGTTFANCQPVYLNLSFYTAANTAALVQEYSDFTLYLYETYQHTIKRFIVADWEGDNAVYCQAASEYVNNPQFQTYCNSNYAAIYGNQSPAESMQALLLWHRARQQGIAAGRQRAAAEGIGGMRVYYAPEFCITHELHDAGFQSVLYDVLPAVIFDYVSYSAYESINSANPGDTLTADLGVIQDVIGSNAIIIGESGFAQSIWGADAATRTDAVINAALSWGVAYVIQWNLYDQDAQDSYGLFDLNGNATPLGAYFQNKFNDAAKYPGLRAE